MKLEWKRIILLAPDGGGGAPADGNSAAAPSGAPAAAPAAPSQPAAAETGGAAPVSEPAGPSVSTQIGDIPADILSLFEGTPTQPSAEPVVAQPGQSQPAAQPQGDQPGVQPQVPASPAQAPAAPQGPSPAELAGQIQTLTEIVSQTAARGQPQQPQGQPQADQVEIPQHGYVFNIPDGLDTALVSDDPATRKTALGALVQGTARTIHTEVVKAMRAEFAKVLPNVVNSIVQQRTTQQSVAQDFYGKYQNLANPMLRPVVQQAAIAVARERGASGWNAELRDAVAERVYDILRQAGFAVPGATAAPSAPQAPAAPAAPIGPAAITPGGARPAPVADPSAPYRDLL